MKIKQRPEDFSVVESYRFTPAKQGEWFVYRMDKQKVTTLGAVERLRERFRVKRQDVSFCGLKDKQGRTEQLIAVRGQAVDLQEPDLRLTFLGRSSQPLSSANILSNRFSVIVRDLSEEDVARLPESIAEVERVGVVNYFDSQRFGFVKHGQGFIAKDLLRGDFESALKALIAHPSELDHSGDAKVKAWLRDHWGEWRLRPPQEGWVRYRPMLDRLRENPRDFGSPLITLDRRQRMMVVFEFQSALWNDSVRRYLHQKVPLKDLIALRYQLGAFELPRSLPDDLAKPLKTKTFPLLGPDTTFHDKEIEAACRAILAREKLSLDRLVVPKLNAFHFKHEERPLFVVPGKLRASEPKEDEENRGRLKVVLSFTLPPGAYATLVVRRLLWYATEEHQRPAKPKRAASRSSQAPELPKVVSAPEQAKEPEAPKTPKKGFLQRQREKKEAREVRRAAKGPGSARS